MTARGGRSDAAPDEGAAAVEFALVSVLLFTLLFGIMQYGMLFFQMQAGSSTARQMARLASAGISDCKGFHSATDVVATDNQLPDHTETLTFDVGDDGTLTHPEWVKVSVTFTPTDFQVPFVPFPATLTRTASARVENVGGVVTSCP